MEALITSLQQTPPRVITLGVVLLLAAGWDAVTARIPNWLTLTAAVGALIWQASVSGWTGLFAGICGWLLGMALLLVPWLLGGLGGGDAKLLGAVGAFLGPRGCFSAFLGTALIGGAAAVALLAWHGALGRACRRWLRMGTLLAIGHSAYEVPTAQEQVPRLRYGIAIAVGTIGVLLLGNRLPGPLSLSYSSF